MYNLTCFSPIIRQNQYRLKSWIFQFADGIVESEDDFVFWVHNSIDQNEAVRGLTANINFRDVIIRNLESYQVPRSYDDWVLLIEAMLEDEILIITEYY